MVRETDDVREATSSIISSHTSSLQSLFTSYSSFSSLHEARLKGIERGEEGEGLMELMWAVRELREEAMEEDGEGVWEREEEESIRRVEKTMMGMDQLLRKIQRIEEEEEDGG